MINIKTIGQKISMLRKKHNMTQDELAEELFVSRQAVSKWEIGRTAPSIDNVVELSLLFNISIEELLCLKEEQGE